MIVADRSSEATSTWVISLDLRYGALPCTLNRTLPSGGGPDSTSSLTLATSPLTFSQPLTSTSHPGFPTGGFPTHLLVASPPGSPVPWVSSPLLSANARIVSSPALTPV